MKWPSYSDYVAFPAGWVGERPAHWSATRLRYVASVNPSAPRLAGDGEASFFPMEAVGDDGSLDRSRTVEFASASTSYSYFAEGDVSVARVTPCFENGKGAVMRGLVNGHGFGSSELVGLRPSSEISAGFLYAMSVSQPFRSGGAATMTGAGGLKRVANDYFRNLEFGLPSRKEQESIVRFLGRETARIGTLIAKQERLIDLLQEKCQALITRAVIKGLDPAVSMKDSGVEWLGEVPAHWSVVKLKRLSPRMTVGIVVNPSEYVSTVGFPFIYGGDIREGVIDTEGCRRISAEFSDSQAKTKLHAGDLLVVRVGAPGVTAVVPSDAENGNCASVMLMRRGEKFDSHWLCYVMNSPVVRDQVKIVQYGAAQEQFNISHAVEFLVVAPPLAEQIEIRSYLDAKVRALDELVHKAKKSISLMHEHRSALISAAVTGKIDVRQTA